MPERLVVSREPVLGSGAVTFASVAVSVDVSKSWVKSKRTDSAAGKRKTGEGKEKGN
jgi:hypothetical protein